MQRGKDLERESSTTGKETVHCGSLFKSNRVALDSELLEHVEEREKEVIRVKSASISKHATEFLANKKERWKF